MAYRALREVKIRGKVYQVGEDIPEIAKYWNLQSLIRRGRVEEYTPQPTVADNPKVAEKPVVKPKSTTTAPTKPATKPKTGKTPPATPAKK